MESTEKKLDTGTASTPPQMVVGASSTAEKSKDPVSDARDKVFEDIPYIGKITVFLLKKFGWSGVLLFMSGLVGAVLLSYFGVMPEQLVGSKYKSKVPSEDKKEVIVRVIPQSASFKILENKPDWAQGILEGLRLQGAITQNADEKSDSKFRYAVEAIELAIDQPSKAFLWKLTTAGKGIHVYGWAFRVKPEGLLQPLSLLSNSKDSIGFSVVECDKGDRLVAILSLTWEGEISVDDPVLSLRSEVH